MDGDLAPLVELTELAERYGCLLLVDEAHATGVFGSAGRGVAELLGVEERITARIGTLSKALGSQGGFVVGERDLIDWVFNRARTYVFSTALAPASAAAATAALDIVIGEPDRRRRLLELSAATRGRLLADGWRIGAAAGPIIPLVLGDPRAVVELSTNLAAEGFYVPGIRPPSVPVGESLLRISLTSQHTESMVDGLIAALSARRASSGIG
jgi:8-amino-7-oxononanoate synthase